MVEVRWHGRGGQGAFTASKILGAAVVDDERYALSFPSFGPERRGAPIQAFTKIGNTKISDRSVIKRADYIVYLDETLFARESLQDLKENGLVFVNSKDPEGYKDDPQIIAIDANAIANKILGRPVSNTAMLAALIAYTGIASKEHVDHILENYLPSKIVEKNKKILDEVEKILKKSPDREENKYD